MNCAILDTPASTKKSNSISFISTFLSKILSIALYIDSCNDIYFKQSLP
jgi:hypothetical protein